MTRMLFARMLVAPLLILALAGAAFAQENPFIEGTERVVLSNEQLRDLLEYANTSKANLELALEEARNRSFAEQNEIYLAAIRKTVLESYRLKPRTELLMRFALNQALDLTFGIPTPDGRGTQQPGALAALANSELLTIILEDSIRLAIRFYVDDRTAIEKNLLLDLPFMTFAYERLQLAREWLSAITQTDFLYRAQVTVLTHWQSAAAHAGQQHRAMYAQELVRVDEILKASAREDAATPPKGRVNRLRRALRELEQAHRAKLEAGGVTPPSARTLLAPPSNEAEARTVTTPPADETRAVAEVGLLLGNNTQGVFVNLRDLLPLSMTIGGDESRWRVAPVSIDPEVTYHGEWIKQPVDGEQSERRQIEALANFIHVRRLPTERGGLVLDQSLVKTGYLRRKDPMTGVDLHAWDIGVVPFRFRTTNPKGFNLCGEMDVLRLAITDGKMREDMQRSMRWHGYFALCASYDFKDFGRLSNTASVDWITQIEGNRGKPYTVQFTNTLSLNKLFGTPIGLNAIYSDTYTKSETEGRYKSLLGGVSIRY